MAMARKCFLTALAFLLMGNAAEAHTGFRRMNLKFYMHGKVSEPNATALKVAGPNGDTSRVQFGTVFVLDDVLTERQSRNSKVLGRGKGTCFVQGFQSQATFVWSAVLENSEYNGTIAFAGPDNFASRNSEVAIVGGTGDFRFAKGFSSFRYVYINLPDSVIFVNATLYYPNWVQLYSNADSWDQPRSEI